MKRTLTITALVLATGAVHAADYPPAVQGLIEQGVEVEAQFEAPSGMTGYAARVQGQPLTFYLTPDGKHVIVGTMLDAEGRNLSMAQIQRHLPEPEFEEAWSRLEESTWFIEGGKDAERVVYVFTDPQCPYCEDFWRASHDYLGPDVQVRNILVAVLGPDSMGKAARILTADDPAEAFSEHHSYGSKPLEGIPPEVRRKIEANNRLMVELGARGTPAVFYRDSEGKVRRTVGMPPQDMLTNEIFQKQPR